MEVGGAGSTLEDRISIQTDLDKSEKWFEIEVFHLEKTNAQIQNRENCLHSSTSK